MDFYYVFNQHLKGQKVISYGYQEPRMILYKDDCGRICNNPIGGFCTEFENGCIMVVNAYAGLITTYLFNKDMDKLLGQDTEQL